jgi:hypothetical protein
MRAGVGQLSSRRVFNEPLLLNQTECPARFVRTSPLRFYFVVPRPDISRELGPSSWILNQISPLGD